jgi:16S rRNA (uracil1498-N3)-methyltransferase
LHVAVAPTKSIDRIEWFLEKAVEIGIDEVSFVECEHSERTVVKLERMEKVAVSAMKQSQQSRIPVINEVRQYGELISSTTAEIKLIAHCEDSTKNPIQSKLEKGKSILVLVGPEGDFSSDEINSALAKGFEPVSLGETRLRTETAALYAVINAAITLG